MAASPSTPKTPGSSGPQEEIAEALGVAISVNAGAAIVYSTRVLDAYAAWAEIADQPAEARS